MPGTEATASARSRGGGAGAVAAGPLADAAAAIVGRLAARPRPAGGAAEAEARAWCAAFLTERGFAVREAPFAYSALPGRWATSLTGVVAGAVLMLAGHVGYGGRPAASLAVLVGAFAALGAGGAWLARTGVLALPLMRRAGVNLVAERGGLPNEPRVWLVAHLDSKSQPVPIGARALGITGLVLSAVGAFGVAAAQLAGAAGALAWWPGVSLVGLVSAVPVALSVVGERSPGALDNASGVAAALLTAAALPNDVAAGVVLTSAEELGLAGARAWANGRAAGTALNFDGVDDTGSVTAMYTRGAPAALVAAVAGAARDAGLPFTARRLLPGILTDGVALADRGWQVLTLSRGTLSTLARIHRPADRAERLSGAGIASVAGIAAAAVLALTTTHEA